MQSINTSLIILSHRRPLPRLVVRIRIALVVSLIVSSAIRGGRLSSPAYQPRPPVSIPCRLCCKLQQLGQLGYGKLLRWGPTGWQATVEKVDLVDAQDAQDVREDVEGLLVVVRDSSTFIPPLTRTSLSLACVQWYSVPALWRHWRLFRPIHRSRCWLLCGSLLHKRRLVVGSDNLPA